MDDSDNEYTNMDTSPILIKNEMDIIMEDSIDGPPSVGSGDMPAIVSTPSGSVATPATLKKKIKNKIVTGYILYSREVRKSVVQNNPESTFGEISRLVGNEWRSLPANEKQSWEEKALKINEENKSKLDDDNCNSPAPNHPDQIYECMWDNCDFQFEELQDCLEHCIKEKDGVMGHVQQYFQDNPGTELHCIWRGCTRLKTKKQSQPFPNIPRLVRHVRDIHINKGNGRPVANENRSKNFRISSKPAAHRSAPATVDPSSPSSATTPTPVVVQKPAEPIFITVPPRPQRALHSEAYIKYIEGLHAENKYVTNWDKTLNVTQERVPEPDPEKLSNVSVWLGKKTHQEENVLKALWALRNQLLRDTLGLQKAL